MGAESVLAGATPWGAVAQGISGLIGLGVGALQRHAGKKYLKKLGEQPLEKMPSDITENKNLATKMALTGLPSEQYQQAMQNIQRQQLTALKGANDRRFGLGLVGALQQGTNDATLNLDVQNANARMANQRQLLSVNNQVAGWKDKLYQNNELNPWMRKYQYGQQLLGAGNQNLTGGLDKLFAGGLSAASGGLFGGGGTTKKQT